jgi:hypothetical protein
MIQREPKKHQNISIVQLVFRVGFSIPSELFSYCQAILLVFYEIRCLFLSVNRKKHFYKHEYLNSFLPLLSYHLNSAMRLGLFCFTYQKAFS